MDLRSRHLSYLLRLWQVSGDGRETWRASLETPGTGERHGFASLEALIAFLQQQTTVTPPERAGADLQSQTEKESNTK